MAVGLQKPVAASLKQQYLMYLKPDQLWEGFDEAQLLTRLAPLQPRWLINCFCNFKFKALLNQYECLNVHLAPLPRYRGRHPLHWALINGEQEFGLTIHQMTDEFDGGEIYWQATVSVDDGMSVHALRQRLMQELEQNFARISANLSGRGGFTGSQPGLTRQPTWPEGSPKIVDWLSGTIVT